ncbi:ABC transporter ATP-binding/permease protein [Rosistilla carotiformis]|uniref:ABC transporter ATP-binding/permease protein n=1 Tax=Rosistilla carotiformis TaxID=2528017 RepID=A0A518JRE5_9BACT|nr:FHA domain-containing protein [Rosistilla carotiformis]QDV68115.1 ABC transporter ATP-binding/permease protein [Rosistilla carotiformis]
MRLHIQHEDGSVQVFDFREQNVCLGRAKECEVQFDSARYPKVSSIHAELKFDDDGWRLIHHSRSNQTLINGAPVESMQRVKSGDTIRLGYTGPMIQVVSFSESDSTPAGTLLAAQVPKILQQLHPLETFDAAEGGLIGRNPEVAVFCLDHPHVSRAHAQLARSGQQIWIEDVGSANGTFVNGKQIASRCLLNDGDVIDIGPFSLELRAQRFVSRSRKNNVQLVAERVGLEIRGGGRSEPLRLLNNIDLVLNPGEFACIVGPSGSGKSTLLRLLSGRGEPTAGRTYVNGRDLHQNFGAIKTDLCVIPQALTLHETLTVEQTLLFTAALRLPPDLQQSELKQAVNAILQTVGLETRRDVRISQLSGGQLKRVGLGTELISDPSLLFLDEVTSGLDEQADQEMMQLFERLAASGKTLVCVTHNLAHVSDHCDLILVLTVGGHLAFFGSPAEAIEYFKVSRLADIYPALGKRKAEAWESRFLTSQYFRRYVVDRKPALQKRDSELRTGQYTYRASVSIGLRQFATIFRRTAAIWRADLPAVATLIGQPLLVGLLLCLVFGQFADLSEKLVPERLATTRNLLFLLSVSCFWLGCNSSVKELVQERMIYHRERNFNLNLEAYLGAKVLFFAGLSFAQSVLLGAITLAWFDPPGDNLAMLGTLCLLSVTGSLLGQAISASAKSEETAIAIVPVVVIPQIILGGVVASLSVLPLWIAKATTTVFWGQKAVEGCLQTSERIASDFEPAQFTTYVVIFVHAMVFLTIAWIGTRRATTG